MCTTAPTNHQKVFFLFQNSHSHLSITFISIALFTYFIFSTCNFILQVFEDLDCMIRNSLNISGKQKMSKKEQNRKIAAVRKQISDFKSRVTKLQSCLRTLREDPDQYFQNLNTDNREYVDWKKRQNKSEKDEENNSSNEKEEEECHVTTMSTCMADTFGFFSTMIGSVSFPSLGGIFSSVPCASPSDQSLSSSDDIYSSVQDSA